jgi:hypothetical protein
MAIPDIFKAAYDQTYALLEARAVWTGMVKAGNRIKLGAKDAQGREIKEPFKRTFQDGDFPQSVLIFGQITDGQQPAQQITTFGMTQGTCTFRQTEIAVELLLGLSHLDRSLADNDTLNLETMAALREGRLTVQTAIKVVASYASVKTWGPIRMDHDVLANRQPNPPLTEWGDKPRPTTIFRIPFVLLLSGQASAILT